MKPQQYDVAKWFGAMAIHNKTRIVLGVAAGILVLIALSGFKSVHDYEGCLLVRNGTIKEEMIGAVMMTIGRAFNR